MGDVHCTLGMSVVSLPLGTWPECRRSLRRVHRPPTGRSGFLYAGKAWPLVFMADLLQPYGRFGALRNEWGEVGSGRCFSGTDYSDGCFSRDGRVDREWPGRSMDV